VAYETETEPTLPFRRWAVKVTLVASSATSMKLLVRVIVPGWSLSVMVTWTSVGSPGKAVTGMSCTVKFSTDSASMSLTRVITAVLFAVSPEAQFKVPLPAT